MNSQTTPTAEATEPAAPVAPAASPAAPAAPADRRHDLDALRSFAMLLGIALHAALAYTGGVWIVSDDRSSEGLGFFVSATHGFRMPLFFLLSGFFSALIWRRRGVGYLVSQRARRIALPLLLACLTILPAMWGVTNWVISQKTEQIRRAAAVEGVEGAARERAPTPDIWTVAAYGDMEGLRAYTAGSEVVDSTDPTLGVTPLGWTAIKNTPEATRYLLEIGANPSAPYKDRNTPMHTACFLGRDEVAAALLRAGADLNVVSAAGEKPADSMRHGQQTVEFIANLLKIPVDFKEVEAGRERIRLMLDAGGLGQSKDGGSRAGPQAEGDGSHWLVARLLDDGFFQHLWFLWLLCWLNAGMVVVVLLAGALPSVRLPQWLFAAPWRLVWLVPVTMLTQSRMNMGGSVPGFGPDTSAGLVPVTHVLLYYATFFGFGALMCRARGSGARLGRYWYVMLPLGLVALMFGTMFGYQAPRAAELVPDEATRRWVSCFVQALYAWLMTFGLLGLFEAVFAKDRPWVRYVSDSSYWLYLVHLPVIVAGQAVLLRTHLPPWAEFSLLLVIGVPVLLASYQLLVRNTPIGVLLNGKRSRTARAGA